MVEAYFKIENFLVPQILAEEKDFLLLYKPPKMHSAPLIRKSSKEETILDWCLTRFPEISELKGRQAGDCGLLHRLDYETHGLILVARNKSGMDTLIEQQREGKILKEYNALVSESDKTLPGFPKQAPGMLKEIQSAFRPFGPGRKTVRPLLADGNKFKKTAELYTTQILESNTISSTGFFSCKLKIWKGFRHQIRCHLALINKPILNDSLYGGLCYGKGFLGLRACSLLLNDPSSGEEKRYSIPPLELEMI